jgi:hypothetical protein
VSPRRNLPPAARRNASGARSGNDRSEDGERYGLPNRESWGGEEYAVRPVTGGAAGKSYRCPGCDQEIRPGIPHVVVWAEPSGGDDRRHWHTACWNARDRRSARLQRSRNAPRY